MFEVQSFELALRALFSAAHPGQPRPMEEVDATIESLFARPLGKMAKRLSVSDELVEVIATAVRERNLLAHTYLVELSSRIELAGPGAPVQVAKESAHLENVRARFEKLNDQCFELLVVRLASAGHRLDETDLDNPVTDFLRRRRGVSPPTSALGAPTHGSPPLQD